jgi:hypothetical protein
MRTLVAAALFALFTVALPMAAAAVPGGKACQVADSAVPTPGLEELVFGSKTDPVPSQARLTERQIEKLAEIDTKFRKILVDLEARSRKLPAGAGSSANAELASLPLPELVERFLAGAARDRALVIDIESAPEFHLANAEAMAAKLQGDKTRWCPLCLAVRQGMEAEFAWKAGELGALSPAQEKEAVELASLRDGVRRKWAAALSSELNAAQLEWLREAQMRWLKSTLQGAVATGMRSLGPEKCEACATKVEWKCEFCSIVLNALDEAKSRS